jgi:hypothetical protein
VGLSDQLSPDELARRAARASVRPGDDRHLPIAMLSQDGMSGEDAYELISR